MAVRITRAGVALTVGIIVVTGLIIGGFFWAKQSGEQARRDAATKIAEQNLEDQSKNVALNNGDKGNSSQSSQNSSQNSDNTNNSSQSSSNSSDTQSGTTNQQGTGTSNGSSNQSSATELPKTGISDVTPIIGAGLLAFVGAAYYRSRRSLLAQR